MFLGESEVATMVARKEDEGGLGKGTVCMKQIPLGSLSSRVLVDGKESRRGESLQRFGEESEKRTEELSMKWIEVADNVRREYGFGSSQRDCPLQVWHS